MIACEQCEGRGWAKPVDWVAGNWPVVCPGCAGLGSFTVAGIARGLAPRDRAARRRYRYAIWRLVTGANVHKDTAKGVLDAMARRGLIR